MSPTGDGGKAVSSSGAWNWTALSQQAVARNTAHAQQRQAQVVQHVKAAAAAVRGPAVNARTKPKATTATPPARDEKTPPLTHPNAETETFSGLRISERKVAASELETEMKGRQFIPLRQMDEVSRDVLSNDQVDWVTIGVVARKSLSKAATNGSSFMVWSLSDLATTELAVFLFDSAYESHWKTLEGTLVAVVNAPLLPASEKNKFALKVSKAEEVVSLGRAVDFGICKGTNSSDGRCKLIVNTAKSQYCLHHIASTFVTAGKRRQQLNNSFSTFNKSMFSSKSQLKNISAGVYGVRPPPGSAVVGRSAPSNGWHPVITGNKRKRSDRPSSSAVSGLVLDTPTVISTSGSVVQRAYPLPPKRTRDTSASSLRDGSLNVPARGNPSVSSRGHKIIASMMKKSNDVASVLRPNKGKRIDMIKFMKSGQP